MVGEQPTTGGAASYSLTTTESNVEVKCAFVVYLINDGPGDVLVSFDNPFSRAPAPFLLKEGEGLLDRPFSFNRLYWKAVSGTATVRFLGYAK